MPKVSWKKQYDSLRLIPFFPNPAYEGLQFLVDIFNPEHFCVIRQRFAGEYLSVFDIFQ